MSTSAVDRVDEAVRLALDPSTDAATRTHTLQALDELKHESPPSTCLAILGRTDSPLSPQTRFFAYQTLDYHLRSHTLPTPPSLRALLFSTLLIPSSPDSATPYLLQKVAVVTVLLLRRIFPEDPSFITDLITLLKLDVKENRDMMLMISLAMQEEVVDLMISRSSADLSRNSAIKDGLRDTGAINQLVECWWGILKIGISQGDLDLLSRIVRVLGVYVTWVDINLIVTADFIALLYQFLGEGGGGLRNRAIECLGDIVCKGMKSREKIALIVESMMLTFNAIGLNVIEAVKGLSILQTTKGEDDEDVEFRERVAKFINLLGLELWKVSSDAEDDATVSAAVQLIQEGIFPAFMTLLADEYDDTSSALFPFTSAYLTLMKRIVSKKGGLDSVAACNFKELVRVVVVKMRYPEDGYTGGYGDEDEVSDDEALFQELRKNLSVFFFSLKGIDTPTFEAFIPSAVCTTFDTVGRKESITWPEVELALHLLYLYGESIKGPPVFFVGGGGPTFLGQMIISMIKSGVVSYPHTSIAPLYFENVCRYTTFFEAGATEYIPAVMEAFARGLHGDNSRVRNRVYYLFLRFVKGLREFILPIRETVLASVGDLLAIEAPSIKPSRTGVSHESQLYLFEAIGMLISYENTIVEPRTLEYLKALVNPMILQIKEIMEKQLYRLDGVDEEGEPPIVRMHLNHLIMAIGSISKGFPEFKVGGVEAPWCIVFREVLGCVLRVLQVLSTSLLIRDAARFTFQRMVNCMGPLILPLLGSLMTTGLLAASCTRELVDILPFFGLIVHKYDASVIGPLFDGLMAPLLSRIFFLLNMATGGDDERREQEELRRGYLTFLAGMLGRGVDGVFVSEVNKGNFENVLGSVVHCAGSGENPVSQKLALSVLWKMCVAWGGGVEPPNTRKLPGSKAPVPTNPPRAILPGFDGWIESTLVPLLWTVGKGLDMKDAGGLGVLGEIGEVHRCLWGGWGERWIGIVGEGMRGGLGSKEAVVKVLRGAYLK